ncbi:MAG TPA: type II secretion system minor pseudopilin GspJ, partial [Steroidobacteraceae bacterium]|nr:type II secretion system minor pseudopilin GspJ [Steroidobacteraceae bacterium]
RLELQLIRGFTLVEMLVSIAIFALITAMAYGGYNGLLRQSTIAEERMERVRDIQTTMSRLVQDVAELEPRPVREPLGDAVEPALLADRRTEYLALLTRSGWNNPAGIERPTLQRVGYRLVDGTLIRDHWRVLDRTLANEPVTLEMLENVRAFELRYLDANRVWQEQWPPLGSAPDAARRMRPLAVEIVLELEDWGRLTRLVEIAG